MHRNEASAAERFSLAPCRERWLEFLDLEHETLLPAGEFARDGEDLLVWREGCPGRLVHEATVPRQHRAALFLQGAAAAAFFGAHGSPLTREDFEHAVWDAPGGTARLWLARTPEWVRRGVSSAPSEALAGFLRCLFHPRGSRRPHPSARALLEQVSAADAALKRGEFWLASTLRCFPELGEPAAAPARQRCLGLCGGALRSPRARALAAKARAILLGREPRVFEPRGSPLTPGGALGLDGSVTDLAGASRRLREQAEHEIDGRRGVWIAVEPERWDPFSRKAFEAAGLALADRVERISVRGSVALPETPAEWRRALFVPCGTLAASVRFYEAFAQRAFSSSLDARGLARAVVADARWRVFVVDPTGDAPVPIPSDRPEPPSQDASARAGLAAGSRDSEDPGLRIERLVCAGEGRLALHEAQRWVRAFPDRCAEAWFPLAARLSGLDTGVFVPWLESIEAEREIAGGRPAEAKARLERIRRADESDPQERRLAALRLAEIAVQLDQPAQGARRAAQWRREHPDAPAAETVRALRLGAAGFAREGRFDCAHALLDEADLACQQLPVRERVETRLARARAHALAGRFEEEEAVYEGLRPLALGSGDDSIAARFLAQEARRLLDRRAYGRAILRFEEALAVSRDDPAGRAELLLDLAAARYHAGEPARCDTLLSECLTAAAAAGREDLARIARGNRIELLINRGAWDAAAAEISTLEKSARVEKDDLRLLVALHHRGRLALRRGFLAAAAADNAQARELAARLSDRLEVGELWLEEGDRLLYEGDLEGARSAWQRAVEDPPDRCRSDQIASERLEEFAWRENGGPPGNAVGELEALFEVDPYRAAETAARWHCLLGETRLPAQLRSRSEAVLRASGGDTLADRVFGPHPPRLPSEALRELGQAVTCALSGERADGHRALESLGIAGLAVRDLEGREVLRLGTAVPSESSSCGQALEAGSARFDLSLWPAASAETVAMIALLLETLLFRVCPAIALSEFAQGWQRLGIATADASMEEPYRRLVRFAPQPVTVLVLGESGSGKEAVARAVHGLSSRSAGPFVPVNVPAIPAALLESELFGHARGAFTGAEKDRRGLLEEAAGGTIFFDEIGDLAPALQSKLLRALQEREFRRVGENRARPIDARVVSATSRDLSREVEAGRFREDLYYRLHVALIRLPPLRERGRDALVLARHFLDRYAREYGRGRLRLAPETAAAIAAYPWPGNVRELQNAIAQAAALCDADAFVGPELLPEPLRAPHGRGAATGDYRSRVDAHRRDLIADALDRAGGNRSRAARDLGLSRQALHYLIRELRVRVSKQ